MSVYSFISGRIHPKLGIGGNTWAGAVGLGEKKKQPFTFYSTCLYAVEFLTTSIIYVFSYVKEINNIHESV